MKYRTQGNTPTRKTASGGVAGALSAIIVYVLNHYVLTGSNQLSAEISSTITTAVTFLVSYVTPPAPTDQVVKK